MKCIADGTASWSTPLTPETDCNGAQTQQIDYVATQDNWKSSYEVAVPQVNGDNITITVMGQISFYNKLNIKVGQTINQVSKVTISSAGIASQPSMAVSASDPVNGAGRVNTYAVTDQGVVYAWGYVWGGMLGNGTGGSASGAQYQLTPTPVNMSMMGGAKVVSLVDATPTGSAASSMYAVTDDGKVYAWGTARWAQMGNGTGGAGTSPLYQLTPTPVDTSMMGGAKVVSVVTSASEPSNGAGTVTTYALADNGRVYAWGYARGAQIGNGTGGTISSPMYQLTPVQAGDSSFTAERVTAVYDSTPGASAAGSAYAITESGKVYAWGTVRWAQIGNGTGGTGTSQQFQLTPALSDVDVGMGSVGGGDSGAFRY